ncbi:hypothetical protein LEN26_007461 [Aphanomyces euteiches]|nr:hypothetical protein AeMF1_015929 [Aphanomyces euteiches]KAH9132262.1 hypothetical protein LEN26_007461 [Aphanomyces euteiches]KAH9192606.1 hypothetical protein AeNC1_005418 [Aphanomyces euteiches]
MNGEETRDKSLQQAIHAEVRHVTGHIQARMNQEMHMHEVFIPNSKAEARCSVFLSDDWNVNPRLCVFMQSTKGVSPGLWGLPRIQTPQSASQMQAFSVALSAMSMIPYIKAAKDSGYAVLVMNPSTNRVLVKGHPAKILHSSTPEEHVMYVWNTYILRCTASQIHLISFDESGLLVNQFLSMIGEESYGRIGGIVYIDSPQAIRRNRRESSALQALIEARGIHFEPSTQPMFQLLGNNGRCTSISIGRVSTDNSSSILQSVQAPAFVFLQMIGNGIQEALQAIKATVPNKLVITVNRARLTGQPYNNPYAVVSCVGQKRETVGNHKKTMDPEWNQTFSFPVCDENATVVITVKDKAFPLSTTVGGVSLTMSDIGLNRSLRKWFSLRDDRMGNRGNGELELTVEWVHDTFVARTDSFLRQNKRVHSSSTSPSEDIRNQNNCYLCGCTFVLHRRRHCRMCLRAVCVSCSDRLFLPGFSEAKRVCTACCNLQISLHKQPSPSPPPPTFQTYSSNNHHHSPRAVKPRRPPPPMDQATLEEANRTFQKMVLREKAKDKDRPLSIEDFDLMKVVGRGAFGKVMLVRKKNGKNAGAIYAMKILKKAHIIQNDQVENTKAEQHILKEISHPYVVRLRYAFQNPEKLYLVMDYYPGGSMYYHLKKSKKFTEERTRLYMAQLLTAIMHLHSKDIAYRDLKLENILMDAQGHIALTDFGLSKEGQSIEGAIRASQAHGGMKTICGTAEYMAPELLRHQPYGKVVDWWSYGILMFEMLTGKTPFVDRNRRNMFKNIMNSDVVYPPYISPVAKALISKLLVRDPSRRLGSGTGGGRDIMADEFFRPIDWDALLRKEIQPVFVPEISSADDVSNVPAQFQNMAALDSPVSDGKNPNHFEDFSYQEESRMTRM